jgi:Cdc6-like AAA superfamily ATPase
MNIVEAYIKENKQMVLLISGFSGSGKTIISRSLLKDINKSNKEKVTFLNLNDFLKSESEYKNVIEVGELKVIDWDSPDAVNWEEFNKKVNEIKNNGVIVSGFAFPKDKISFKVDFHIHLKMLKDDLIKNRADFTAEKIDDKTSRVAEIGEDMEKRILNKITFPHYLNSLQTSAFNKMINVKYGEVKEAYDEVFVYIMEEIKKRLK